MKSPSPRLILTLAFAWSLCSTGIALANDSAEPAAATEPALLDSVAVFEQLKSFEGTWTGSAVGEGADALEETPGAIHEFRVASAGTVVMETMNQGTAHEMINMYHVDGDDLRLTHYCAGNNQPHMKLNRKASTSEKLIFDFVGGTNLDPDVDSHIHAVEIAVQDGKHITSSWTGYSQGEPSGIMRFKLGR